MKCFFTIFLLLLSLNLRAQQLEFSSGISKNMYFNLRKNDPHQNDTYNSPNFDVGFYFALDDIKVDSLYWFLPLRFEINYNRLSGSFKQTSGGLGGSSTIDASFKQDLIGLGIYLFNGKLSDIGQINFGFEGNYLIHSKTEGRTTSWQMGAPSTDEAIDPATKDYYTIFRVGLTTRLAFYIPITDKFVLEPYYRIYLGLIPDISAKFGATSFRQNLGLTFSLNL